MLHEEVEEVRQRNSFIVIFIAFECVLASCIIHILFYQIAEVPVSRSGRGRMRRVDTAVAVRNQDGEAKNRNRPAGAAKKTNAGMVQARQN